MNNSALNGGPEKAINIKNTVSGEFLLYAPHGEISLLNSGDIREVTGYRVYLGNVANVIYEIGLANLLFESGPGGSWEINVWEEI